VHARALATRTIIEKFITAQKSDKDYAGCRVTFEEKRECMNITQVRENYSS